MNQEETRENIDQEESPGDAPQPIISKEYESLPTESIYSYGRLEELITDEDAESSDSAPRT